MLSKWKEAQLVRGDRGISWSDIVKQHKEFEGHTSASVGKIYRTILSLAKIGKSDASLKEVADFAKEIAGKEKREGEHRKKKERGKGTLERHTEVHTRKGEGRQEP